MKQQQIINLIFSVNGKTVAIQPVINWTVQDIVGLIRIQNKFYPERDYRIKRKEVER